MMIVVWLPIAIGCYSIDVESMSLTCACSLVISTDPVVCCACHIRIEWLNEVADYRVKGKGINGKEGVCGERKWGGGGEGEREGAIMRVSAVYRNL